MFANPFKTEPPLDAPSIGWLFDAYAWSLRNLDARVFFQESILVTPTNKHFPGRETSVQGMARLIFSQVASHAGMGHWPFVVLDDNACSLQPPGPIRIQGPLRGSTGVPAETGHGQIPIGYDPGMLGNPEALIAAYAHALAHHLGSTATEPPPGGAENWPQLTEVVAVFLGFGLMFANSAFNFRPAGCGSCGGNASQRQSFLSQYDITYALALFCELKGIPQKALLGHLKKSLRGFYKRCIKDIHSHPQALQELQCQGQGSGAALSSHAGA